MNAHALYTIGYEGAMPADFWATLRLSNIKILIDIRDVPFSRKPGFSKKSLEQNAPSFGIDYVYLRGLGDPKRGRDAAKVGNYIQFQKIFLAHLETEDAISDLAKAMVLATASNSCLLCYERKPEHCHRSIVAAHMVEQGKFKVYHLGVRAGVALKLPSRQEYCAQDELRVTGM